MTGDDTDEPSREVASHRPGPATGNRVSRAVVEAVADAREVEPLALDRSLFDAVDPDALEALCDPVGRSGRPRTGKVVFEFDGYRVEVGFSGEVTVYDGEDGA